MKDLTGIKFGNLTVLKRAKNKISPNGLKRTVWECLCVCGNKKDILASNLQRGFTQSCGCLRKESTRVRMSKKNEFVKLDAGYEFFFSNAHSSFVVDEEDFLKIKKYCWYLDSNGYVATSINKKKIYLHRFILNCDSKDIVDHIDRDKSNNKRSNIRIVTITQNNQNRLARGYNKNSTGLYYVSITVNKKRIYLGQYKTKKEAREARILAEKEYFGEYAPVR